MTAAAKRLGEALAQHIAKIAHGAGSAFVRLDAIPTDVASAIADSWPPDAPRLAIASYTQNRFGEHALRGAGTELRNGNPEGVCLVVCEGTRLDDEQSLQAFANVAPADLLETADTLTLLAHIEPTVRLDGVARDVRSAIEQLPRAERPSALSVCAYLSAIAEGGDPLEALPALGAFRDNDQGSRNAPARIRENLQLAARRQTDEMQSQSALGDIRRRAERVLSRRGGGGDDAAVAAAQAADDVMRQLQSGDDAILADLAFDEAREILQRSQPKGLPEIVAQELDDYRRQRAAADPDAAADVPWDRYRDAAHNLASPENRQTAAIELLDFDSAEQRRCLQVSTRKKLDGLLKDRQITVELPELGLIQAARALEGGLGEIRLAAPEEPPDGAAPSRRNASRTLALSCARMRLGLLLHDLHESFGVEIDPALLTSAEPTWPEAFEDAELTSGNALESIKLRLGGRDGKDVLIINWRPDLDDLAALRAAVLFSEQAALSLESPHSPTLEDFCAGPAPAPAPVEPSLRPAAAGLQGTARALIDDGLSPELLAHWTACWREAVAAEQAVGRADHAEALSLAGAVRGQGAVGLTPLAPLKAEWLGQQLDALWTLLWLALHGSDDEEPLEATAQGVARATASHYPAHLRVRWSDRPLLPSSETRVWSSFGGPAAEHAQHGGSALRGVIGRLLQLQPEAAGHLRCLASGPGAADLLVREAAGLVGAKLGNTEIGRIEIFCIADGDDATPKPPTLADADERLSGIGRERLELRYLPSLDAARETLQEHAPDAPAVHLALVCGITGDASRLTISTQEVDRPPETDEALFVPRTSMRPRQTRRMLLAPPAATKTGLQWLELMQALDDGWADPAEPLGIPELRTAGADLRPPLEAAHDIALWVATLDPYATRDSLQAALGEDVAILHQERRLGGDSPLALVISQKSGGPADSAIGRSLQAARIVRDRDSAIGIGADLRKVAAQGYGILALEAATTGAGVNELVGHVVAFSMLATQATPWPLPPGCRLVLISLDDYKHWFPSKRGDLLVLALDEDEPGIHAAIIEVKARRSDANAAGTDALDQLRQTLRVTRWAGYPDPETYHSRLWLNRIAEAALSVARESNLRLTDKELQAVESFRTGHGTLEWAGIGLVFGPAVEATQRDRQEPIAGDLVPISIATIKLTEELLRAAAGTNLSNLRTVEAEKAPLGGGRVRRRPERAPEPPEPAPEPEEPPAPEEQPSLAADDAARIEPTTGGAEAVPGTTAVAPEADAEDGTGSAKPEPEAQGEAESSDFTPPILGWDVSTGEPLVWVAAGPDSLSNGHTEIWGSSGAGKTQFVMALLSQLAAHSGTHFGIADFKNDYDGDFPGQADARFIDLWAGASFNPLALPSRDEREIRSAVIELRDIVDVAAQSFTRMGVRQKAKLKKALEEAYDIGLTNGAWPTLATLDGLLDDDLRGVIGDLTGEPIFGEGEPLGDAINENVVFGLSRIPGNGLTTVLAAGFILSALQLRMQGLDQIPNTVRYAVVVDEAHRVSGFKAVDTMIREGRSKGLAVLLATQQPGDLPEVVATNAQTKICFRLPDAGVAAGAARRLDPGDRELPEQIRTLGQGEAYASLGGEAPRLLRMAQSYKDREALGLS